MAVQINGSKKQLTPEEVEQAEQKLGYALPDAYKKFLLDHNGGRPQPADFKISWRGQPFAPGWRVSMVDFFLAIHDGESANLLDYVERFDGRIPPGMLPIARDPGGNLVLVGVSGDSAGKIFFWVHELEGEFGDRDAVNLGSVAVRFDAFLDGLHYS